MAQYKHVFSPFQFGNVVVKNRMEVAPMLSHLATYDGCVTKEMIRLYQSFARGGFGIVTAGDTAIDNDRAMEDHGSLCLGDDRVITGLAAMVEAIQKYGAKASIEINHPGRHAFPRNGKNPIGPSSLPASAGIGAPKPGMKKVQVEEMTRDMIDQVVDNYASAAYRCMRAGFEMILLHGGHRHLLAQFVALDSNKRTDLYGGSLENRARFVIEVLNAIRNRVGNRLAIEYRISGNDFAPGGMDEVQNIEFLKLIQDKIDLVNVSLGAHDMVQHAPYMIQPTYFTGVHNVERAAMFKKALKIPVTCIGAIPDLATAEKILAGGKAEIVAMARAALADPEIVNKSYRGEIDDIRPCVRCNTCGVSGNFYHRLVCAVNPMVSRESEFQNMKPASPKKKVAIVGGGPAGMQAAIIASGRGHQVTLYEKEKELGGSLRYASAPPFKADMKKYMDWLVRMTKQSPVEIKLGTEATASSIKAAKPDELIIAVGGEPIIPDIPGINKSNVVWAGDVDTGKVETGKTIVVAGAGLTGCEAALYLAMQGKKVTVIDMIPESDIAKDALDELRDGLMERLSENHVEFKMETKLDAITDHGAMVINKNWERFEIPADTVVLSLGVKARLATVEALQGLARERQAFMIGDCKNPANLLAAIHDAFNVAIEI